MREMREREERDEKRRCEMREEKERDRSPSSPTSTPKSLNGTNNVLVEMFSQCLEEGKGKGKLSLSDIGACCLGSL